MAINSASFAQERHKSSDSSVIGIKSDGLVVFIGVRPPNFVAV